MTIENQPKRILITNSVTTGTPPLDMQQKPKKARRKVKLGGNRVQPISAVQTAAEIAEPTAPAVNAEAKVSGLQKKVRFQDKHNRVTTYINKESHEKLKEVRKTYGIAVSETINAALIEYFRKRNL